MVLSVPRQYPPLARGDHPWHVQAVLSRKSIWLASSLISLLVTPAWGAERQVLRGHVPIAAARSQSLARLPGSQRLDVVIGLPLRNRAGLTNLLNQLQDPATPNYRRYLSPDQFAARFGPTPEDYQKASDFAQANGLNVRATHPNRTLLEVGGSIADIERTFHVKMRAIPHPTEARTFYAPDADPSVDLNTPLLAISGLDNYILPHPRVHIRPSTPRLSASPRGGSAPNGDYLGYDFRAAYAPGVSLIGAGQVLALIEFDGYYPNDITRYRNLAGLPSVPLQDVGVAGFSGPPGPANIEVALDIEMAIAMAPGLAKVLVYEAPNNNDPTAANTVLNRAATDGQAMQISCSWGFDINRATDQIFQQYAAQGQSFFLASGDSDAFAATVDPPSDNPYITIVGGTTLSTSGPGGTWLSETTWNRGYVSGTGYEGSSGGISAIYPIPSWQQGIDMSANQGSTSWRNLPDVALTAENVWVTYNNGISGPVGGTSCAAPLWAGFIALANEQAAAMGVPPVGFINPAIYAMASQAGYGSVFHDITTGNNFNTISPGKFAAVPGFDLCTGWGTPTGSNLINALVPFLQITPRSGFTAAGGPIGGLFNVMTQTFLLTNISGTALNWTLGQSAAWLHASPASGTLLPGDPAATVTVSLNPVAATLPSGIYTANIWFTNAGNPFAQSRLFTVEVGQPIVHNGSFETGDFSSWNLSGTNAAGFLTIVNQASTVNNLSDVSLVSGSAFVHSGAYGTELGENGSVGYLGQTLPTFAGQPYLLSFWVEDPYGGTPSEWVVKWNGHTILDQTNTPAFGWTNLQFLVAATGPTTDLEFGFRNDPNAFALDDVSVTAIPGPAFQSATRTNGNIFLSWSAWPGLAYQVQSTTNLTSPNWINLGNAITATNGTLAASGPVDPDPQRFYRVVLLPDAPLSGPP